MLKIVTAPNSILAQKAKTVPVKQDAIDPAIIKIVEEMKSTLLSAKDPIGVGLAAPQVGKDLQIFITKPSNDSPILTFINPKLTLVEKKQTKKRKKNSKTKKLEGCLSLPNIWGEVQRSPIVNLEYIDEFGKEHNKRFSGFMATIIQHEMDHLSGMLFPKRVLEQKGTLYKSEKNEKGEDIFDEIKI